ncbi:MAG: efflux RND transporter periplasmic adaptor subunit [Stagnimonas sp.]|nr:efflux RND transporter periplasmic adaptor subunit [Stagnimonas sp.]
MTPAHSCVDKTRSSFIITLLCGSLLAAAGLVSGCGSKDAPAGDDAPKTEEAKNKAPLELSPSDVAVVSEQALVRKLPLSGSLSPLLQTTVKSKVAGELLSVAVREGQAVKRGDVLLRIDTRNQGALVASQEAGVEKAEADLALAKLNLDNNKRLLEKNFIAQNVLDSAQANYGSAVANVKLARAQLKLAQIGLEDAVVRAPFDGTISRRMAEPGEKVSSDSPLLGLISLDKLELQAAAPASEIPLVAIGQLARVRVDGFGTRLFEAKVERINPTAEQGSRSILLYLSLDNSQGVLKGGMFAQGALVIEQSQPAPAVPTAAVRSEAGLDYVMVIEAGKLVQRPVKLGLRSEDEALVEITEGLKPGEQVVIGKLDSLKAGQAVLLNAAAVAAPADTPAAPVPASDKPAAEKPASGG